MTAAEIITRHGEAWEYQPDLEVAPYADVIEAVDILLAEADALYQNSLSMGETNVAMGKKLLAQQLSLEKYKSALLKVIEMNRQQAEEQYGDADKAEGWACVRVCREALQEGEKQ